MFSFMFNKKVLILAALLIIGGIVAGIKLRNGGSTETVMLVRGDLVRTVELAGKVIPKENVDLAFEVVGTVSRVNKKVGDSVMAGEEVAMLDDSSINADLLKAEADLVAARAELEKLEGGKALQAKITSSKTGVVQDILQAYTLSDDAVYNKIDQFFQDSLTPNPRIIFSFDDYVLRNRVNESRVLIGKILTDWNLRVNNLSAATYVETDLEKAKSYLREISIFLDDVSRAVNSFKPSTSITQTQIDKYKTDVATARQNVNSAADALISGEGVLIADFSDLPVQVARVSAAEATAANYRAKLAKMTLKSPISGVVSRQDAKVGEVTSANVTLVSVISGGLEIESYVPEVSVAGVRVGALADVALDAYGDDVIFKAAITHIDPRETIRDGVSTYKIKLSFSAPDERIRSGMTSNIIIETMREANSLLLPERAVIDIEGTKKVFVKSADNTVNERVIQTGNTDTSGNIEILGGLSEGEAVVLNPNK